MDRTCALGLDFGTNSVRALIVDTQSGEELGTSVSPFPSGKDGIILDESDPNFARQHPKDYLISMKKAVHSALQIAQSEYEIEAEHIIGIGMDTTASSPLPLDEEGIPLVFHDEFADEPAALVWLWKDHTSIKEAQEITRKAAEHRPEYLAKCGGTYSSEWFWSKVLHCARHFPHIYEAATTWIEHGDWMAGLLIGETDPADFPRSICAAGHKGLYHKEWGGYPDLEFLEILEPKLTKLRQMMPHRAQVAGSIAGKLCDDWAKRLELKPGIPVANGAIDAHLGAVGSGIKEGTLVKALGTSSCDMMVVSLKKKIEDIPGLCGIVPESIVPGHYGLEAGQSAVGDIYNWFVEYIAPKGLNHRELTHKASELKPGESGLLGLDWHNGNRTILIDPELTGTLLGMTLHTRPEEIYRSLIESTAFGSRIIIERCEEYDVPIENIVICGGIGEKNDMVLQIYADVMNRPIMLARSGQAAALGAAICGAVAAGTEAGGHVDIATAQEAMAGVKDEIFNPNLDAVSVYEDLYQLYKAIHDAFGTNVKSDLSHVMKDLIGIRNRVRS